MKLRSLGLGIYGQANAVVGALQRDEEFSAAGQSGNSSQVKTRVINNRYKVNFAGKWWQSPGWYDQVDNASVTTYVSGPGRLAA